MNAATVSRSAIVTFLVAVALLLGGHAERADAAGPPRMTRTIGIGVRVNTRCLILVNNGVYFPNTYESGQAASLDAVGSLLVDCDPGRKASIRLSEGLHKAPGSTAKNPRRRMADAAGTRFVTYNLYEDAARTIVWDDFQPGVKTARAWPVNLTVYARMPGGQTVYPGTYTDTIVASLFF